MHLNDDDAIAQFCYQNPTISIPDLVSLPFRPPTPFIVERSTACGKNSTCPADCDTVPFDPTQFEGPVSVAYVLID